MQWNIQLNFLEGQAFWGSTSGDENRPFRVLELGVWYAE